MFELIDLSQPAGGTNQSQFWIGFPQWSLGRKQQVARPQGSHWHVRAHCAARYRGCYDESTITEDAKIF